MLQISYKSSVSSDNRRIESCAHSCAELYCILKSHCNGYEFCYLTFCIAEGKFESLAHLDYHHVCSSTSEFDFNTTLVTLMTEAAFNIKATSLPILEVRGLEPT